MLSHQPELNRSSSGSKVSPMDANFSTVNTEIIVEDILGAANEQDNDTQNPERHGTE